MSYKNENMKTIELHENGLDIQFRIRENGVVELADFSSQEVKKAVMEPKEDICYPAVEMHRKLKHACLQKQHQSVLCGFCL